MVVVGLIQDREIPVDPLIHIIHCGIERHFETIEVPLQSLSMSRGSHEVNAITDPVPHPSPDG